MRIGCVLAACLALTSAAHAYSAPAYDVVVRHDGSILQGHVAELHPGESVTLVLLSGESRTIPWEDIASTRGPTFPVPPPPPDPNLQPGPGRVPLRVESSGAPFSVANNCPTPCTLYVPPGPFDLPTDVLAVGLDQRRVDVPPGGLRLEVRPASPIRSNIGRLLLWPGAGLAVGGVVLTTLGAMQNRNLPTHDSSLQFAGYGMLGVGAVLLTTSIVLWATSRGRLIEHRNGITF